MSLMIDMNFGSLDPISIKQASLTVLEVRSGPGVNKIYYIQKILHLSQERLCLVDALAYDYAKDYTEIHSSCIEPRLYIKLLLFTTLFNSCIFELYKLYYSTLSLFKFLIDSFNAFISSYKTLCSFKCFPPFAFGK